MAGRALHIDGSDKKIERGGEGQRHRRAGGSNFRLDVGKAAGGKECADALTNLVAIEGLIHFLWKHLEQVVAIWYARQCDGLNNTAGVERQGGQRRGGLGRLPPLRWMRRCERTSMDSRSVQSNHQNDE